LVSAFCSPCCSIARCAARASSAPSCCTRCLYPLSISFIVTGLTWQWLLSPTIGVQQLGRDLGWTDFVFDWITQPDRAIYTLVFAGIWHQSGLIMAIMLAGLRGVDREIWRAARIEGIPTWRTYVSIILPMLRPLIVTCVVLIAIAVHIVFGLSVMSLLFRNFYAGLPEELVKAARIDGAGFWRIFAFVMLPMSVNILIVATILQTTGIWNDYLLGLIFAGRDNMPMTVQLNAIATTSTGVIEYNVNTAAALLTALPPLLIYFVSGRYFVRGITAGAVKG
jgi:ABC-type glycerol-3-phosphate transport system permease component